MQHLLSMNTFILRRLFLAPLGKITLIQRPSGSLCAYRMLTVSSQFRLQIRIKYLTPNKIRSTFKHHLLRWHFDDSTKANFANAKPTVQTIIKTFCRSPLLLNLIVLMRPRTPKMHHHTSLNRIAN